MHLRNKKIYHFLTFFLTVLLMSTGSALIAQEQLPATSVYNSYNQLPYATISYNSAQKNTKGWKIISKPLEQLNDPGYINRPYHNPNLIQQREAQQKQAALKKAQAEKVRQQEYNRELTGICQNVIRNQIRRRYTMAGPINITRYKVTSRKVVPFKDYKQACVNYRKKLRSCY
jgi:hypothetical protein